MGRRVSEASCIRQRRLSRRRSGWTARPTPSLAVASGAHAQSVQRMLGHASAAMTLDVYSGLFDDDLAALADRIDAAARATTEARVGAVWARPTTEQSGKGKAAPH